MKIESFCYQNNGLPVGVPIRVAAIPEKQARSKRFQRYAFTHAILRTSKVIPEDPHWTITTELIDRNVCILESEVKQHPWLSPIAFGEVTIQPANKRK